jgi:hypothetical protein
MSRCNANLIRVQPGDPLAPARQCPTSCLLIPCTLAAGSAVRGSSQTFFGEPFIIPVSCVQYCLFRGMNAIRQAQKRALRTEFRDQGQDANYHIFTATEN